MNRLHFFILCVSLIFNGVVCLTARAGGEDAIRLPPLNTPEDKLAFLIELKKDVPNIFEDSARYGLDLFGLVSDEERLLQHLREVPGFVDAFRKKKYHQLTVVPPKEGIAVGEVVIKSKAVSAWKQRNENALQKLKEDQAHLSPESALLNTIIEDSIFLEENRNFTFKSGELFRALGKSKGNQETLNKVVKKGMDEGEKLQAILDSYDSLDIPGFNRETLEKAVRVKVANDRLASISELYLLIHSHEDGLASWDNAEAAIQRLGSRDLTHFHDKNDVIAPKVEKVFEAVPVEAQRRIVDGIYKNIDSFAKQTETIADKATSLVHLRQVPPSLGILRGCVGGDCSSSYSFPYPNDPREKVFFIFDESGHAKGYVSGTEVKAEDGTRGFYVITVSGPKVSAGDTELILRGLEHEKENLGYEKILLPAPGNIDSLINFSAPNGVYKKYTDGLPTIGIQHYDPHIRKEIEGFYSEFGHNSGEYDHSDKNQAGVVFVPRDKQSKLLKTELNELHVSAIAPKPIEQVSAADVLEFIIDMSLSGQSHLRDEVLSIESVKKKLPLKATNDLLSQLKRCENSNGQALNVQEWERRLEQKLTFLVHSAELLKSRSDWLFPAIASCKNAFSEAHRERIASAIIEHLQKNDYDPHVSGLMEHSKENQQILRSTRAYGDLTSKLLRRLRNGNDLTSVSSAQALGRLGHASQKTVAEVVSVLKNRDRSLPVREAASYALQGMEISDSDVHREMMNILADASEDPNARIYAGWVLQRVANLNDPHIFQELLKLLEKESPYSNFNLASEVLKHFEPSDKEVHKNLLQILDDLENPLRKKLIPVISMNPFALADLEIQKALARAVVDKGFDVSNGAEEGLLGAGAVNIETARELLKHLESHRAARILMSMHLSDPELHRILVKSLKSEDEGVRENAADVLASVREPDSLILQALVGALRDPSQSVQEHAASALGKLGLYTTEVKEGLLEAVDHSDGMALAAIAQSLGKMGLLGNSAATLKLLNALGERPFFLSPAAGILNAVSESHPTDPKIHQKMASLIDQFGTILGQLVVQYFKKNSVDPALVESKVIKFLDDPVPDKRLIAARILKNLRLDPMSQKYLDRKILKSIIPILNDFAPGNRVWASKLIRQIEARNPDLLDFEQHQALFHLKNYYADFTAGCQKDPIQYVLDPHQYEELQDALLKLGVHFENHSNGF